MPSTIFFDISLPNSATWFYFSLFLAIALFFQFNRLVALRNWDLLALFLFVPGFLLLQEANERVGDPSPRWARERLIGYCWLLGSSAFWFGRCLVDLAAVKRPLVTPNLSTGGLAWFGGSLFVCLVAVGLIRPNDPWGPVGKRPAALTGMQDGAAAVVAPTDRDGEPTASTRFWVERSFALGCHLAVVVGLLLIGVNRFGDLATGVAAATLYLLIPYTAYHVGQVHHVWPAALITWAVYCYRRPTLAGALVGLAAGTTFFPILLLPVWVQFYRARGAGRFLTGASVTAAVGLLAAGMVLYAAGEFPTGIWKTLNLSDWQPWKQPTADSIWTGAHWAYRLPLFIAYAGFVVTAMFWPPVRNLGHLIALSAAVFIGIQFWFADRGGLYVLWYAPLVILVVLRPNLSEHVPVSPGPPPQFVLRAGRWMWGKVLPPRATEPVEAVAA